MWLKSQKTRAPSGRYLLHTWVCGTQASGRWRASVLGEVELSWDSQREVISLLKTHLDSIDWFYGPFPGLTHRLLMLRGICCMWYRKLLFTPDRSLHRAQWENTLTPGVKLNPSISPNAPLKTGTELNKLEPNEHSFKRLWSGKFSC